MLRYALLLGAVFLVALAVLILAGPLISSVTPCPIGVQQTADANGC